MTSHPADDVSYKRPPTTAPSRPFPGERCELRPTGPPATTSAHYVAGASRSKKAPPEPPSPGPSPIPPEETPPLRGSSCAPPDRPGPPPKPLAPHQQQVPQLAAPPRKVRESTAKDGPAQVLPARQPPPPPAEPMPSMVTQQRMPGSAVCKPREPATPPPQRAHAMKAGPSRAAAHVPFHEPPPPPAPPWPPRELASASASACTQPPEPPPPPPPPWPPRPAYAVRAPEPAPPGPPPLPARAAQGPLPVQCAAPPAPSAVPYPRLVSILPLAPPLAHTAAASRVADPHADQVGRLEEF